MTVSWGGPMSNQPPQPYPPYQPQVPVRKKRSVGLTIAIIAVGLAVLCCGFVVVGMIIDPATDNASNTSDVGAGAGSTTGQPAPAGPGLNQPARDGKFEFTVTGVQCGQKQIGGQYVNRQAQGQFCLVSVTVKNIGNEARTFTASNQHAFNAAGQKYDADGAAGMYLEQDSRAFLEDINPGNSVNGTLVFDIPADASITKLELHDSSFSGGVTITVA